MEYYDITTFVTGLQYKVCEGGEKSQNMTLAEIKSSNRLWLTPAEIAEVLGCDPDKIRKTAETNPALLGFAVTRVGTRTRIWRKPFLKFIGEGEEK